MTKHALLLNDNKPLFSHQMPDSSQQISLKVLKISFFTTLFAIFFRPLLIDLPMVFTYFGIINCLGCLIAYLCIRYTRLGHYHSTIVLGLGFSILTPLMWISGGLSSHFVFIMPLLPLIAVEIGGSRHAIGTTFLTVLCIVIFAIYRDQIDHAYGIDVYTARNTASAFWLITVVLMSCGFAVSVQKRKADFTKKLSDLAEKDPLTQVLNRRGLNSYLEQELKRVSGQNPLSILLIDIDHFKHVNDEFGHDVGDICLIWLTEQLTNNCRRSDLIARMGGEEFLIVLPNTNQEQAAILANKLTDVIRKTPIEAINRSLTLTIGVAQYSPHVDDFNSLFKRSDMALYQGKNNGRDQVVCL